MYKIIYWHIMITENLYPLIVTEGIHIFIIKNIFPLSAY